MKKEFDILKVIDTQRLEFLESSGFEPDTVVIGHKALLQVQLAAKDVKGIIKDEKIMGMKVVVVRPYIIMVGEGL